MTLANCKDCGKLVTTGKVALCQECAAVRDKEMTLVRDCIRYNNNVTLAELSYKTGLPTKRIIKFIHEGLIELKG